MRRRARGCSVDAWVPFRAVRGETGASHGRTRQRRCSLDPVASPRTPEGTLRFLAGEGLSPSHRWPFGSPGMFTPCIATDIAPTGRISGRRKDSVQTAYRSPANRNRNGDLAAFWICRSAASRRRPPPRTELLAVDEDFGELPPTDTTSPHRSPPRARSPTGAARGAAPWEPICGKGVQRRSRNCCSIRGSVGKSTVPSSGGRSLPSTGWAPLPTRVGRSSDLGSGREDLVDRSEAQVLEGDAVDLWILVIQRDREPDGDRSNRLVLAPRQVDHVRAPRV